MAAGSWLCAWPAPLGPPLRRRRRPPICPPRAARVNNTCRRDARVALANPRGHAPAPAERSTRAGRGTRRNARSHPPAAGAAARGRHLPRSPARRPARRRREARGREKPWAPGRAAPATWAGAHLLLGPLGLGRMDAMSTPTVRTAITILPSPLCCSSSRALPPHSNPLHTRDCCLQNEGARVQTGLHMLSRTN